MNGKHESVDWCSRIGQHWACPYARRPLLKARQRNRSARGRTRTAPPCMGMPRATLSRSREKSPENRHFRPPEPKKAGQATVPYARGADRRFNAGGGSRPSRDLRALARRTSWSRSALCSRLGAALLILPLPGWESRETRCARRSFGFILERSRLCRGRSDTAVLPYSFPMREPAAPPTG